MAVIDELIHRSVSRHGEKVGGRRLRRFPVSTWTYYYVYTHTIQISHSGMSMPVALQDFVGEKRPRLRSVSESRLLTRFVEIMTMIFILHWSDQIQCFCHLIFHKFCQISSQKSLNLRSLYLALNDDESRNYDDVVFHLASDDRSLHGEIEAGARIACLSPKICCSFEHLSAE